MSAGAPTEGFDSNRPRLSVIGVVAEAIGRIVRDPLLALPFALAGLLLAVVDWLRLHDPVPAAVTDAVTGGSITLSFHVYPSGVRVTDLPLGALVDLRLPYLLWTVGLELGALAAVGFAGWLTLARAGDVAPTAYGLASYLGLIVAVQVAFRLFAVFDGLGWLALVAFVVVAFAFVRTFLAPALVVAGDDLRSAVGRSYVLTTGHGATAFGLVLAVGLSAWLVGRVPSVGPTLSFAVVAPVHAVAVVVFAEAVARER